MTTVRIGCVVEGHGEVAAVPILLRRLAAELRPDVSLVVVKPVRTSRSKLVKEGEIERAVALASLNAGPGGAVVVIVDADDDCPATLGPVLYQRARQRIPQHEIVVVLAKREFECWFIAAARSLRGARGLADDAAAPADPESVSDGKGWIKDRLSTGTSYRETVDQPAFAALFSLGEAAAAGSFAKLRRDFSRLLNGLAPPAGELGLG